MNANLIGWLVFAACMLALAVAVVLFARNNIKRKAREDQEIEFLRGGPGTLYLRSDEHTACDGCGCLLRKESRFERPPTIAKRGYVDTLHGPVRWMNAIVEHYLCLRCQVDGTPPAKMAEAIDQARAEAGEKPC